MSLSRRIMLAMTVVVLPVSLMAQGTVTGFVRDTEGVPIHGANVMVEETALGAATDASGYFNIANVPAGEVAIIVDVIGYEQGRQTITVPGVGSVAVNFVLEAIVLPGEEVVVVGYGTQQRREITGSVARVSSVTFRDIPVLSFENAIQGLIAGVDIQEHTGEPGGAPNMRIRGTGSITAGNDPLYVIDGLPMSKDLGLQGTLFRRRSAFTPPASNPLATLNPNDIESIEILKDASAAAIYGSRGSNGVVLITTKRPKAGAKPTITFDAYTGTQSVAHFPDMMKAEELIEYTKESRNNNYLDRGDPFDPDPESANYNPLYNPDNNDGREDVGFCTIPDKYITWAPDSGETDWLRMPFQDAPIKNYNFSSSGGGEGIGYVVSSGYLDEQGTIGKSRFQRYSLSARLTGRISDAMQFGLNLNTALTENDRVPAGAAYFGRPPGIVYSAIVHSPVIKVYNADGTYNQLEGSQSFLGGGTTSASHPLAIRDAIDWTLDHHRTFGNAYLDVELMKDLNFKSSLGIDLSNYQSWFYRSNELFYRGGTTPDPYAEQQASGKTNWVWENTINYRKSFNDIHNLTALVMYSAQRETREANSVVAKSFSDDQIKTVDGGIVTSGSGYMEEWSLVSMLGRLNYNYKYRYLITLAIRSDRSSRFGPNNQTGYFPSVSVAWRLSEEPLMQRIPA
ncbi:MAG: SusC/RagA family TonB-linked outer membrane protein, partial [Candidatus Neomarinimicrobiota bacterium]